MSEQHKHSQEDIFDAIPACNTDNKDRIISTANNLSKAKLV